MLDREIRQELESQIEEKFLANGTIMLFNMMLTKGTKENAEKFSAEAVRMAKDAARETVTLIIAAIEAGKIPARAVN